MLRIRARLEGRVRGVGAYSMTYQTQALQDAVGLQRRLSVSAYLRRYETHAALKMEWATFTAAARAFLASSLALSFRIARSASMSALSDCIAQDV